jgi:hypothetical protein
MSAIAMVSRFIMIEPKYSKSEPAILISVGVLALSGPPPIGDTVLVLQPWELPSSRRLPPTTNCSEPAASAPIIPSTIVIILIGVSRCGSGPGVPAYIMSSRWEARHPGPIHDCRGDRRPHRSNWRANWSHRRNRDRAFDGQTSAAPSLIVGSRRHQTDFVHAIDAAHIKPVIDRSFDLNEIADAFRYEASGQHFGKICLEF